MMVHDHSAGCASVAIGKVDGRSSYKDSVVDICDGKASDRATPATKRNAPGPSPGAFRIGSP
jgi:hypothetical protein